MKYKVGDKLECKCFLRDEGGRVIEAGQVYEIKTVWDELPNRQAYYIINYIMFYLESERAEIQGRVCEEYQRLKREGLLGPDGFRGMSGVSPSYKLEDFFII